MTLVQAAFRFANYATSAVFLLLAGGSLVAWALAILHWGSPQPYATAVLWSLFTTLGLGAVIFVEWLQNGGA